MAVRIIGEINRHLITPIVSVHMGGQEVALLDAQGNSLIGDLPDAPTIIGTIADRVYVVGQTVAPTDLRTKFSDATSYVISPAIAQAVIEGYNLTFDTTDILAETTVTVRGVNARGQSEPLAFKLRVNAPSPQVVEPIPDQSLLIGAANASIPLDDHFSGAASYAVSPTGQGASISGRNLVLSAATARNLEITITATNATGQSVTESFALVVAAQSPDLSVQTVMGVPQVSGTGDVTWTITAPAEYAGTYADDRSNAYNGKLSIAYTENTAPQCIVPVSIRRVGGTDDQVGAAVYRATPGLWQVKAGATQAVARLWYLDGVSTGIDGDQDFSPLEDGEVQCREVVTVEGQSARSSRSNTIAVAPAYEGTKADFTATDGTSITAYDDPSGYTWKVTKDASVILRAGYARGNYGMSGWYYATRSDPVGADHWAEADFDLPAPFTALSDLVAIENGPAVRVVANHNILGASVGRAYVAALEKSGSGLIYQINRINNGLYDGTTRTILAASATVMPIADFAGKSKIAMRLSIKGSTLTLSVDGVTVLTATDTTFADGIPGIWVRSNFMSGSAAPQGISTFDAGAA